MQKGWRFLTDANYRWRVEAGHGRFDDMPDEEFIRRQWRAVMGYNIDLAHPRTFNEKLQWLKLHDRRPEYTQMVDKYRVRDYIREQIGEEYLIPLLGVWDDPEEIDFAALPQQFVLKCNHNSGLGMCICTDKSQLDIEKVKAELRKGLRENFYLHGREWPYKDVSRKIVAEQFMTEPSGQGLNDYKVLCFNGEPRLIEYHAGRLAGHHTQDFYDTDWQLQPIYQPDFPGLGHAVEPPASLEKMLAFSRQLAKGMYHVRLDWYDIAGKLYFGEITFYDGSGHAPFTEYDMDLKIGNMMRLPSTGGAHCNTAAGLIQNYTVCWQTRLSVLADWADAQEAA